MGYTAEFISGLPDRMRQECSTLAAQIDALEKEKDKLQLPKDVVVSFQLVKDKQAEAVALINDAKSKAAKILLDGETKAAGVLAKANETVDIMRATVEKTLRDALAIKAKAIAQAAEVDDKDDLIRTRSESLQNEIVVFDKKVKEFHAQVAAVVAAVGGQ